MSIAHGLTRPLPAGHRHRSRARRSLRAIASPLVVAPALLAVFILVIWQLGVFHTVFNIKPFTVPYPASIGDALAKNGPQLIEAIFVTLPAALSGYVLGMLLGLGIGSLLVRFAPRLVASLLPILSSTNAVPIVALVPILALWLDDGWALKVFVVAFMTTPTMVIYSVRGLTNVEPTALELMASIEASPNQVYGMLRLPTSLPFLFTALKSSVVLALIGAIVAETIRGFEGLGFVIADSLSRFDAPKAWLALLVIAAIGIGWYLIVEVLERVALPWESASRKRT
jgi:NitT/TauT family transport system permease protein